MVDKSYGSIRLIDETCNENNETSAENSESHSAIKAVLSFLDPEHAIMLDSELGLLGIMDNSSDILDDGIQSLSKFRRITGYVSNSYSKLDREYSEYEVAYARSNRLRHKRGDYFQLLDKDGVILIDEYITHSFIIGIGEETCYYMFIVKDKYVQDDFETLLGEDASTPAIVLYMNEELYTNCAEIDNCEYRHDINVVKNNLHQYSITIDGDTFISHVLNYANNIYTMSRLRMQI